MGSKDTGVTAGRGGDVQVEVDVIPQPVTTLVWSWYEHRLLSTARLYHQRQLVKEELPQTATSDHLSVAIVQGHALVAHVLPIDALGARGHADHLGVLYVIPGGHDDPSEDLAPGIRGCEVVGQVAEFGLDQLGYPICQNLRE